VSYRFVIFYGLEAGNRVAPFQQEEDTQRCEQQRVCHILFPRQNGGCLIVTKSLRCPEDLQMDVTQFLETFCSIETLPKAISTMVLRFERTPGLPDIGWVSSTLHIWFPSLVSSFLTCELNIF
jgi:hypothetical protein